MILDEALDNSQYQHIGLKVLTLFYFRLFELDAIMSHVSKQLVYGWNLAYSVFDEVLVHRNAFHNFNDTFQIELSGEDFGLLSVSLLGMN